MAIVDLRQRAGMLFLAVMVGHVLLISAQVTSKRGVSFLATAALGAFGEVERGIAATTTGRYSGRQPAITALMASFSTLAMPPRGGNPDLSDTEVARAIVFMANQSGASFQEPAAKAAPAKK